jgi:hypothetical protein
MLTSVTHHGVPDAHRMVRIAAITLAILTASESGGRR